MLIGPICSPPSASATPSATPRMITGNAQMMSSSARMTRVRRAPEVAGDQAEHDRQERRDDRGGDADHQRVAAAVEQPHHDVAAVAVGAEEELAVRLEPLRADRHAVEADDVLLLAVDLDRVREVVRRRAWSSRRCPPRAARRRRTSDEQHEEERRTASATLLRRSRRRPSRHGPSPWTLLPLSLLLPGGRALKGRLGCRLSGQFVPSAPSQRHTTRRGGRRSALPVG